MAERILNLELVYKNKRIDTAIYGRDFDKEFFIGTDKHLFWEILDNSFPFKHKFVIKKGANYVINLFKGMNVEYKKNETVAKKECNSNSAKFILDKSTEGTIHITEDYSINYKFKSPYKRVITEEDKKAIRLYKHYTPIEPGKKTLAFVIVISLIICGIGEWILSNKIKKEMAKKKPTDIVELARKQVNIARVKVSAPKVVKKVTEKKEVSKKTVDLEKTDRTKQSAKDVKKAQKAAKRNIQEQFNRDFGDLGDFDDSSMPEGDEMIAQFNKEEILSTGEGSSLGGGKKKSRVGSSDDLLGESGDVSEGFGEGIGDLGEIGGLGDLAGSGIEIEEIQGDIGGSVGSGKIVKIAGNNQFKAAVARFAFATAISEDEEVLGSGSSEEHKSLKGKINSLIKSYSPQLDRIYDIEKHKGNYYGLITFTLLINKDGSVASVKQDPGPNSKFSQEIYNKFLREIKSWKLDVGEELQYSFKKTFRRN